MEPQRFERKTFVIEAMQVSLENITQVIEWVNSSGGRATLMQDDIKRPYISIDVRRPANQKQTMAYIGDWVTKSGIAFRIYTDSAFHRSFEETEKPVDPYQTSPTQNVFERDGVERKTVVEENPVGDERDVQPGSVEKVIVGEVKAAKDVRPTPFSRTPDQIREAHRTGANGLSEVSEAKLKEYNEKFFQQHGRYPGQAPGEHGATENINQDHA